MGAAPDTLAADTLAALRRSLVDLEQGFRPGASEFFALGLPVIDTALGGGLARAALHELHAATVDDAGAAVGFAAVLGLKAAAVQQAVPRSMVWVRRDGPAAAGQIYPPGLAELGLDPARLLLVRARDAVGVLRAGAEALRCPALGAVLIELWGEAPVLDLTASRRLSLAAARSGVTALLLRIAANGAGRAAPSAAMTRWAVRAVASVPLAANAPGLPAFAITLLRHRAGVPGQEWHVEWDRDRHCFRPAAPLPRPVAAVPADRSATLAAWPLRRAG